MGSTDIQFRAIPAPRDHFEFADGIKQLALQRGADPESAELSRLVYLEHHGCLTDADAPPEIRALLRKAYRTTIAPRFEAEKAQ